MTTKKTLDPKEILSKEGFNYRPLLKKHKVWWETDNQEERNKSFKKLVVEETLEEKARMSELRKQIEIEIANAPTWWDSATPEERADAVSKVEKIHEEMQKETVEIQRMIEQFNKDFPNNPI
jgi:hypothetical protein